MSAPPPATATELEEQGPPAGAAPGPEISGEDEAPPRRRSRLWGRARIGVTLALLGAAAYFIVQRASEVASAWHLLGRLEWRWVGLAVLFEAASMVIFARMQRWLLRAGGVTVPLGTMVEITLAGNAMAATLPGGVAWAGAWVFGQLRRRGVSRFLRIWMFLVAGAVSSFALFIVVVGGIELAGNRGPVSGLRWGALALAAIPVLGVGLFAVRNREPLRTARRLGAVGLCRVGVGRWVLRQSTKLLSRIEAVQMSWVSWAEVLGLGLLNWLDDCAVLILCLVALHVAVPWRGIFVVYGLTQIAAAFPITPGGLGVVEGSLGALLHAYGVPLDQAVATVIVYRIVSFWGLVPLGWGVWIGLDVLEGRGRRVGRAHPWAEHPHRLGATDRPFSGRRRLLREPRPCLEEAGCPAAGGAVLERSGSTKEGAPMASAGAPQGDVPA